MFFSDNYPNFLVYYKEFELDPKRFLMLLKQLYSFGVYLFLTMQRTLDIEMLLEVL